MSRMNSSTVRALCASTLAAGLAAAVACSDSTGPDGRAPLSLSLAVGTSTAAVPGTITGDGHTLTLLDADLTIRDLRLERDNGRDDGDSDSDGPRSDDALFRTGPLTLALPLDGRLVTSLTGDIPFGAYHEIEADLEFLRLRGSYDGSPFDVTLAIDDDFELELSPPLVINAGNGGRNVTLNFDVAPCFRDSLGAPIDLRLLQSDSVLRTSVRGCILGALRAYEDQDRDGDEQDSDSDNDSDEDSTR